MFNTCYLLILYLIVINIEAQGEICSLPTGGEGQCIPLSSCISLLKTLAGGGRPQPCGFQGILPLVCCPTGVTREPIKQSKSTKRTLILTTSCFFSRKLLLIR
ncbi:hypothetical protein ILUMI_05194 [Ignelater luminosus]|uniref:Clip domain-containing protein n=1 Tax=Ignelater luminosus TaxID=2038154 RepID=A0A8K0DCE3_IGNLU|nr:hypothetical protein ILUMI_05194 [Ignelater luminosus]